jgi:hypothetical protein
VGDPGLKKLSVNLGGAIQLPEKHKLAAPCSKVTQLQLAGWFNLLGMYVCLIVDLPEQVAQIAVDGWWHIAGAFGLIREETMEGLASNLPIRPCGRVWCPLSAVRCPADPIALA